MTPYHLTVKSKFGNFGGEPENDRQHYMSSPPKIPSSMINYTNLTIIRPKIPAKVSGFLKITTIFSQLFSIIYNYSEILAGITTEQCLTQRDKLAGITDLMDVILSYPPFFPLK